MVARLRSYPVLHHAFFAGCAAQHYPSHAAEDLQPAEYFIGMGLERFQFGCSVSAPI